jgi:hypothetical protein
MRYTNAITAVAVVALLVALVGCETEREVGQDRAILKAGQQVKAAMVGWVAVPNTSPKVAQDKGISYAVISAHNIIPTAMDGWVAMNPTLFTKMTEITVAAPTAAAGEKWVLKPEGKRVPQDKDGWAAVPPNEVQVEASSHQKDLELAKLAASSIAPKELNGWVAVDSTTLATLVEKYMKTGPGSKVSK